MNDLLIYLLKANLALVFLYVVYYVLFRNTTLHQVNRAILLSILVFSVSVPFIQFKFLSIPEPVFIFDYWTEEFDILQDGNQETQTKTGSSSPLNITFIGLLVYSIILGIMLLRFMIQLAGFNSILRSSSTHESNAGKVVVSNKVNAPFTLLKWIFIPDSLHGKPQMNRIIAHEEVHAKHLHTLDLLITELFCIIFWFNPFVFLLKRSLKTVHEYIADQYSATSNAEKIELLSLLASGVNLSIPNGISSNFYWSTLKNRIKMITKNKSSKLRKLSYLLLIPAFGLIFMSFSGYIIEPSFISTMKLDFVGDIPSIHPVKSDEPIKITSGYGMRFHPILKVKKMHRGVDFKAKIGTPVVSTADGEVIKSEGSNNGKGYGQFIIVKHNNGFSTLYSQLSEQTVKKGDKVKQGQIIGKVGSSGFSTGPHLHYEITKDGENVNPVDYIPEIRKLKDEDKDIVRRY